MWAVWAAVLFKGLKWAPEWENESSMIMHTAKTQISQHGSIVSFGPSSFPLSETFDFLKDLKCKVFTEQVVRILDFKLATYLKVCFLEWVSKGCFSAQNRTTYLDNKMLPFMALGMELFKWNFVFSYCGLKHRLWVLIRTRTCISSSSQNSLI